MEGGHTVLVTGGSGFLGGWCLVELLRRGYRARTTVRDLAREQIDHAGGYVRARVVKDRDPRIEHGGRGRRGAKRPRP